jgi:hypothetical protein
MQDDTGLIPLMYTTQVPRILTKLLLKWPTTVIILPVDQGILPGRGSMVVDFFPTVTPNFDGVQNRFVMQR